MSVLQIIVPFLIIFLILHRVIQAVDLVVGLSIHSAFFTPSSIEEKFGGCGTKNLQYIVLFSLSRFKNLDQ